MQEEFDTLYVNTWIDSDTKQRFVLEKYGEDCNRLSAEAAKTKGEKIFTLAGVAQAIALFMESFILKNPHKGFQKPNKQQQQELIEKTSEITKVFIQELKAEIPEDISIGFGYKFSTLTAIPIIALSYGENQCKLHLDLARNHAKNLMGAAEAVQTDNFLHHFLHQKLDINFEKVQILLHEFSTFREANVLEELFEKNSDRDE